MTRFRFLVAGLVLTTCMIGSTTAEASSINFAGETVQYTWLYPDLNGGSLEGPFTAVVGPGTEFVLFGQSFVPIDVSATNITFNWDLTGPSGFTPATFSGARFFDIFGTIAGISGVTLNQSTLAGFDSSRISFDANTIWLNFQSLQLSQGHTTVSVDVQFAAGNVVPEPASMFLLGSGLLGLFAKRRRRLKA